MKLILASLTLLTASASADVIQLFDGKTLDGWKGDSTFWKVEDGTITGESTDANPLKNTTYLHYSKQQVNDFELNLSFRFLSKSGNSGIQYRSQLTPNTFNLNGYQADLETGKNFSGILYDQGGRGIVARRGESVVLNSNGKKEVTPLASGKLAQDSIKHGEWNTYKVIADGTTLKHFINGHQTVNIVDNDVKNNDAKGWLGLQLHKGPSMKIQFKDIHLKELDHKVTLAAPQWIWAAEAKDKQNVIFTKSFDLKQVDKNSTVKFTCDNGAKVFINDKKVAESTKWEEPQSHKVAKHLKKGMNTIRVEASNSGNAAGFILQMGKTLKTDASWKVQADSKAAAVPVKVVGVHGDSPWGKILDKARLSDTDIEIATLPGFEVEKLYSIPKAQGSWVSMVFDDKGNLYCCDENGSLYRLPIVDGKVTKVEAVKSPGFSQGLCWAYGSLYLMNTKSPGGIYRMTDTNNDGVFDKQEHIVKCNVATEHGGHSIIKSDKGGLYYISGNYGKLSKEAKSINNNNWQEDTLLSHLKDSRGHARNIKAPGGHIVHFDKDGGNQKVVATGFRNPYDIALSPQGSLFTYDADMEWDAGTPWYRPTRINHATFGSEFGWRTGSSKWPEYFADSLPGVIDIGPGSPTGVLFGTGAKFPQKYQDALYALDWTFGRIYAIHLKADGSSYTATKEPFLSGKPLPLSDATIGPDGAMYFLAGGRRVNSTLYRVHYTKEIVATPSALTASPLKSLLDSLVDSPSVKLAWDNLNHSDRRIRFNARVALERLPLAEWLDLYKKETDTLKVIESTIALARLNKHGDVILQKLAAIDFAKLVQGQKLSYLRALSLAYIRTKGSIKSEDSQVILKKLDAQFPAEDYDLNVELARLLTKLESKSSTQKMITLMESVVNEAQKIDADLLKGNDNYGHQFKRMLKNQSNSKSLRYALMLMSAKQGWNDTTVTRFYTWLNEAEQKEGGASYKGFIKNIRTEAIKHLPENLKAVANKAPKPEARQEAVAIAKGPGQTWTMETAKKATLDLSKANAANGMKMFQATLCMRCHTHGDKGGDSGPNLTNLAGRFNKEDVLKAIIDPSEVISEQYEFQELTMTDGSTMTGKVLTSDKKEVVIAPSAFSLAQTIKLDATKVKSIKASKVSPMPASLINSLNPDELRDLIKFLTDSK